MPIIYQLPTAIAGTSGVYPNFKFMVTGDTIAAMTTAGYLNSVNLESAPVSAADVLQVLYGFNPATGTGTYAILTVSIANGVITLAHQGGAGEVVLPTIANHIATFTNTDGTISEDPATALSGGNIQAGLTTGTAGKLYSCPGTTTAGRLALGAVASAGAFDVVISNASHAQASTYSITDCGNAAGRLLNAAGATPFTSGNFPMNSGTAGLMVDSGIPVSSILSSNTAVLLSPSGNQIIVAHNLTVAAGNLQAGSSGNAGTLASFPASATTGQLIVAATANSGNFNVTLTNASHGQSTVYSVSDAGNAVGRVLNAAGATPFTNGNLIKASGTTGLMVDAGVAPSAIVALTRSNGTVSGSAVSTNGNVGIIAAGTVSTAVGTPQNFTWTNPFLTTTCSVALTYVNGSISSTPASVDARQILLAVSSGSAVVSLTGAISGGVDAFISYIIL